MTHNYAYIEKGRKDQLSPSPSATSAMLTARALCALLPTHLMAYVFFFSLTLQVPTLLDLCLLGVRVFFYPPASCTSPTGPHHSYPLTSKTYVFPTPRSTVTQMQRLFYCCRA
uniref:Uncharacterized protein n=1 Tax=Zea mays TaxID=4577 RepID=C0P8Y0_MAIZE|nr:unknown [Zea mays]|eukprot:NP_001168760.1 uncharacterized protein LOC100382557 [Zea mays]